MNKYYKLPFKRALCDSQIECEHDPIHLAGRYTKYSRKLPQTAWLIKDERIVASSIEEQIGNVLEKELSATSSLFNASGREDIDVRCLGNGRPFIIEFIQPKRTSFSLEELKTYQNLINKSTNDIAIRDLQAITRLFLNQLEIK
jgi:tRNA pseudouridine synthase 10